MGRNIVICFCNYQRSEKSSLPTDDVKSTCN